MYSKIRTPFYTFFLNPDYGAKFLMEYDKFQHENNLQNFEKLLRANGNSEKMGYRLLNISASENKVWQ